MPSGITVNEVGHLVLSWQGDLWLGKVGKGGERAIPSEWKRLTSSVAIERDPVWHPNGKQLFYASDEKGAFDIWQVALDDGGQPGEAQVVVESRQMDTQPNFDREGNMAWVRGTGAKSDIWLRDKEGKTAQVTSTFGPDHSPALHPEGKRLCYVSERQGATTLMMMNLDTKKKSPLQTGKRFCFHNGLPMVNN